MAARYEPLIAFCALVGASMLDGHASLRSLLRTHTTKKDRQRLKAAFRALMANHPTPEEQLRQWAGVR